MFTCISPWYLCLCSMQEVMLSLWACRPFELSSLGQSQCLGMFPTCALHLTLRTTTSQLFSKKECCMALRFCVFWSCIPALYWHVHIVKLARLHLAYTPSILHHLMGMLWMEVTPRTSRTQGAPVNSLVHSFYIFYSIWGQTGVLFQVSQVSVPSVIHRFSVLVKTNLWENYCH